jgi:hypothetical protein
VHSPKENLATRVALNGGEYTTFARRDGRFTFYDLPSGVYVLDVLAVTENYSQFKIDFHTKSGEVRVLEYRYPGATKLPSTYPLVIKSQGQTAYFEVRQGMSVWSILKQPMVLMMLFSGGMMFLMPKMMENMDPEEMKNMQEEMGDTDPQAMLRNMFGGGKQNDDDSD